MYLIQRIEEMTMQTGDARKTVAEFVLQTQEELFSYSIDDIAKKCYTSKSTVSRFAKHLGFSGWREFLKSFRDELAYQEQYKGTVDVNYPFSEDSSDKDIIESLLRVQMESLVDTAEHIDRNSLNRAVNFLIHSKHVVIFSRSPNYYLAELFSRKMLSVGKNVENAMVGEAGLYANGMGKGETAILISYSGNNPLQEPMKYIPVFRKNGASIIAITSEGDNYLRKNADAVLTISSRERLYSKISNFATEESIGYLLNLLFSSYFARDYERNRQTKEESSRMLEQERIGVLKEQMES